jgi:hypothetical protein
MFPTERRKGDCGNAINSDGSGNSRGNYARRPSRNESLWKKMIGKPDSGKPTVRFDEGGLEIEPSEVTTPVLYSTIHLENAMFASGRKAHSSSERPERQPSFLLQTPLIRDIIVLSIINNR